MTRPAAVRALLVVDVQPTFCEGGELPVAGGNDVAHRIADFVRSHRSEYALVATSQDWHQDPGAHFAAEPDYVDTWPPHGLAGSAGAQLHPALKALAEDPSVLHVRKGAHEAAYSAFDGADEHGHPLAAALHDAGVTDVDVAGLALSHCVAETALDATAGGWRTRVFRDLSEPVTPELGAAAVERMVAAGVTVTESAS